MSHATCSRLSHVMARGRPARTLVALDVVKTAALSRAPMPLDSLAPDTAI